MQPVVTRHDTEVAEERGGGNYEHVIMEKGAVSLLSAELFVRGTFATTLLLMGFDKRGRVSRYDISGLCFEVREYSVCFW